MLSSPSGPRTTPGISGNASWKRSFAIGAVCISCRLIRSTRAGESPCASLTLPATFTSSRSVSSSSRIGASVR